MDVLTDLLTIALAADGADRVAVLTARLGELATDPDVALDLAAVEAAAVGQFESLYGDGTAYDPAQAPTLEALADAIDAVRSVRAVAAATARAGMNDHVAALAGRVRAAGAPAGVAPGGAPGSDLAVAGGEGTPDLAPPATAGSGTPVPGPAGETAANDTPPPTGGPNLPARLNTAAVVVAAGGGAVSPARQGPAEPWRRFAITASAEVPNTPYGKSLSLEEVADAAGARYGTFPQGQVTAGPLRANVALVHRRHAAGFQLAGDQGDAAVIDRVADERRLPGGSLVQAAGKALTAAATAPGVINDVWCTPSETDYTLCPALATTDGMLDLPTTGMPARGGIRYPVWNQYPEQAADVANNGWHGEVITYPAVPANPGTGLDNPTFFHRDPADVPPGTGLGNLKRCITGPCVSWAEVRASVSYLCVESDILRDRTFPEGLRRFLDDVMVHHQHWLNEQYVGYMAARADPVPAFSVQTGIGSMGSASLTAVDRLALLITWFRGRYKMGRRSTLEIVAPEWFGEYLKRDLEKKQNRPYGAVSDAEIAALFGAYTSRVQWIRDWQEIGDGTAVGGRIMPPAGWPSSVRLMAYPAGSWVLSEGNVLTLGVQYDPTLLKENRYSAMFTEDSWLLLNRCNRTFTVELTDLCANGAVGPQRDSCLRVTTILVPPGGLQLGGAPTATTVGLLWDEIAGAASYQVQRSTNGGTTWTDVTSGAGGTPATPTTTVTGLVTGTSYHFRVAGINADGVRGAYSTAVAATTA